jgi:prevent-host-death family protein
LAYTKAYALCLVAISQCDQNDHMAKNLVGSRELKVRLGTYLQRVRGGQTLIVTDRGAPVAELRPLPVESATEAILTRLEASGAVARPTKKRLSPFRPIESRGDAAAAAVIADRDDRF